jgi:hypothetical protein
MSPVRADDRLAGPLIGDADELAVLLVPRGARRCRRSLANPVKNHYFGRVETVRDLVMFLAAQPRSAGVGRAAGDAT